ncbi:MAG: DUF3572 domain-containing protein [Alphaproteobacteria bacterium]|nr:DUF3572 domain-containing protein [Alphaproteobacteria bacterium]
MTQDQAEILSIQALAWLSAQQDLLEGFLAASGSDADSLKQSASDPAFLGAVLDYILTDDRIVTTFCQANGLACDRPQIARQLLPGGEVVNWT